MSGARPAAARAHSGRLPSQETPRERAADRQGDARGQGTRRDRRGRGWLARARCAPTIAARRNAALSRWPGRRRADAGPPRGRVVITTRLGRSGSACGQQRSATARRRRKQPPRPAAPAAPRAAHAAAAAAAAGPADSHRLHRGWRLAATPVSCTLGYALARQAAHSALPPAVTSPRASAAPASQAGLNCDLQLLQGYACYVSALPSPRTLASTALPTLACYPDMPGFASTQQRSCHMHTTPATAATLHRPPPLTGVLACRGPPANTAGPLLARSPVESRGATSQQHEYTVVHRRRAGTCAAPMLRAPASSAGSTCRRMPATKTGSPLNKRSHCRAT